MMEGSVSPVTDDSAIAPGSWISPQKHRVLFEWRGLEVVHS